jgi:hypothetical protein
VILKALKIHNVCLYHANRPHSLPPRLGRFQLLPQVRCRLDMSVVQKGLQTEGGSCKAFANRQFQLKSAAETGAKATRAVSAKLEEWDGEGLDTLVKEIGKQFDKSG